MKKSITLLALLFLGATAFGKHVVKIEASAICWNEGDKIVLTSKLKNFHGEKPSYQWQVYVNNKWKDIKNAHQPTLEIDRPGENTAVQFQLRVTEEGECGEKGKTFTSNIIVISKCCILPINFHSFSGYVKDGKAYLSFVVEGSEKVFVQSSEDGRFFIEIGRGKNGTFIDNSIIGTAYYRLRAIATDGEVSYSTVLRLINNVNISRPFYAKVVAFNGRTVARKDYPSGTNLNPANLLNDVVDGLSPGRYVVIYYQDNMIIDRKKYIKF